MMKTLYLSDLDGTLLRPDETLSDYTAEVITSLVKKGVCFSFATARSRSTTLKVTKNISISLPIIVYNGAFISDSRTGRLLYKNTFSKTEAEEIYSCFKEQGLSPMVYSLIDGVEKFSYVLPEISRETHDFIRTRAGDPRDNPLQTDGEILSGEPFYFNCIGDKEQLRAAHEKLGKRFSSLFYDDIYSGCRWLELMPKGVSKAAAALELKKLLGAQRLVVFGDAINDIALFGIADEAYAVANAAPELKAAADGVIGANTEDAVAKWLAGRCGDGA